MGKSLTDTDIIAIEKLKGLSKDFDRDVPISISGVTLRRISVWGLSVLIFIGGALYPYRTEIKLFFIDDALDLKLTKIMPFYDRQDQYRRDSANLKVLIPINEKLDKIIAFNNYLKPILEDMPEFKAAVKRVRAKKSQHIFDD